MFELRSLCLLYFHMANCVTKTNVCDADEEISKIQNASLPKQLYPLQKLFAIDSIVWLAFFVWN